jgi:hypothetical protein
MTDYAALMRQVADEFPLPEPERSSIPIGSGIWTEQVMEGMLAAWKEQWKSGFDYEPTGPARRLACVVPGKHHWWLEGRGGAWREILLRE